MTKELEAIKKSLLEASEERYRLLKEWEHEAQKWKSEGDMYGWNFFMGMASGANWVDIVYGRVIRALMKTIKDLEELEEKE